MLVFSNGAKAATMSDLAGDYEVSSTQYSMQGKFLIDADGKIKIMVYSPWIYLVCSGDAQIENSVVTSTPACENGIPLTTRFDLSKITNFQSFKVMVYTSLLNTEMEMEFKRL